MNSKKAPLENARGAVGVCRLRGFENLNNPSVSPSSTRKVDFA